MVVLTVGLMIRFTTVDNHDLSCACGIFDDPAMLAQLKQDAATIRKAMVQAKDLHASMGSDLLALNQKTRWIMTKKEHCSKIITTVGGRILLVPTRSKGRFQDGRHVCRSAQGVPRCHAKCHEGQAKHHGRRDRAALDAAIAEMGNMYLPA